MCRFLLSKQAKVRVMDTRDTPSGVHQLAADIPLHTGGLNQQWLLESDLIVISPGVSLKTREIHSALRLVLKWLVILNYFAVKLISQLLQLRVQMEKVQ